MIILYIVKFWLYCFNHSITQSLSAFQSLNFTPWSMFTKTSFNVSLFKELFLKYIEPQTSMRALLRKLMITAFLLDLKDPLFGFLWSSEELSCSTCPISWCWYLLIWKRGSINKLSSNAGFHNTKFSFLCYLLSSWTLNIIDVSMFPFFYKFNASVDPTLLSRYLSVIFVELTIRWFHLL